MYEVHRGILRLGLGWQVHLALTLSQSVLVIKDLQGNAVCIDDTAAADYPSKEEGWYWNCTTTDRTIHHMSPASPSLLRQLRQKLKPGARYIL